MNDQIQKTKLTNRETQVCALVKKGMDNREIASHLFISVSTVKNHLRSIHKKLKVQTRAQLMARLNQA